MTTAYTKVSTRLVREGERLAAEVARLREAGEAVPPWRVAQLERYRDLMTQTQAELGRLGTASAETIAELQREGLTMGMDMAEAQVQRADPARDCDHVQPLADRGAGIHDRLPGRRQSAGALVG